MTTWEVFQSFGLALGAIAALAFLAHTIRVWLIHRRYSHIPSPKRSSFFLGHLPDLTKSFRNGGSLCSTFFNWCTEHGDTYVVFTVTEPRVFTVDPESVKALLITENFPKPEWPYVDLSYLFGTRFAGYGLITARNHEEWSMRRSFMNPCFSRKLLKPMTCDFDQVTNDLLDKLETRADGKTVITMLHELQRATMDIIGKVAYSMDINAIKDDDACPFLKAIETTFHGFEECLRDPLLKMNPFRKRKFKQEVREAALLLRKLGAELMQNRREALKRGDYVPDDFLSAIFKMLEQTAPEEREEIGIDMFISFFVAGQETTANTIAFAFLQIGRHPEVFAKLRKEVDEVLGERSEITYEDLNRLTYCELIIKETLRIFPASGLTSRVVNRDGFTAGGYAIPKGTRMSVSTFVSSRMERFNPDALAFKPERWLDPDSKPSAYTTYPFTLGPRTCIGVNFSKMEAKVVLAKFVQRFDMNLDPTQSFDFMENAGLAPKDGVRVTLTLRK